MMAGPALRIVILGHAIPPIAWPLVWGFAGVLALLSLGALAAALLPLLRPGGDFTNLRQRVVSWWVMERTIHWEATEHLLWQMKTPVLVIWGKQDTVLDPHLYLERWRQVDPHATIVEIDQAGHAVQEDQPGQVSQALLHFLAV